MTGTLAQDPMIRRRRGFLQSQSADILFRIFSFCYENHLSDRDGTEIGPITKDDVSLDRTQILPKDSLCQEDTPMDETRVVLDTQEDCLFDTQLDLAEPDHRESTELCHNVDIDPSVSFDVNDQDNLMDSTLSSSLPLPTVSDVEEGEISGDFMDFTPENFTGIESLIKNDNNLISLSTVAAEDAGKDMARIVNTNTRNLVDYSELDVHGNSREPANQPTAVLGSDSSLQRSGRLLNLDNSKKRNQDLVRPVKRQGPSSPDERACKKVKKLVDLRTCPENIILVGEDASRQVIDAFVNKDAANEKKEKRVVTQESKAKKWRNARIKRAQERKKLGMNRPKHEIVVKEKKISICRHYMMGRCHEGDKCKFSHDSIPLTKSKPCCHFARHACMKGDDCPYDHQLSKYPCNKLLSRIKRAEERKKLGMNRPKLEIVVKEKKISICRHFMMGRCHEGDKCKFSHDSIPLTKSKPCCHFARQACMKGDDCPYDHQLSKYPCNKLLSTGACNRGSRCLFCHDAQPIEPTSDALSKSMPDQESRNSGSKRVDDTKSCWTPKSVASNTERNPVDITPKVFTRPPKGIRFLSQKRSPVESRSSPDVDSELKETPKTSSVTQDPKEITNTPRVVPTGINFLSFGKKPYMDNSNGGFSFKISNGIGKSPLGNLEGECSKSDSAVNVVNGTAKPGFSQKPLPMVAFMSSTSQKALQSTLALPLNFRLV